MLQVGSEDANDNLNKKRNSILKGIIGLSIILALVLMLFFKSEIKERFFQGDSNDAISEFIDDKIAGEEGKVTTITESTLQEIFSISELATAEYTYSSIAHMYEEDGETPMYHVAYSATIMAGIDFSKIIISVNEENKVVTLKMPNCEIQSAKVNFESLDFIFEKEKYNNEGTVDESYELCKSDLETRIGTEDELLEIAKGNAEAVVEALVIPWINQLDEDYIINIE